MPESILSQWHLWERWDLVTISIVVHLIIIFFFISSSFVRPKKIDFRSKGILTGFIIALYFEMYGIPLTIYLLQPFLSEYLIRLYPVPFVLRMVGSILIFIGFINIYLGWKKIHSQNRMVKEGIYSVIRHPQYVGLMLLTLGQLIQWPTVTALVLWPGIVWIYYRLALMEEKEAEQQYGKEYENYKKSVPGFIPNIVSGKLLLQRKKSSA